MTTELLTTVSGLREAFKVLKPAISTEETRYYLNGIYFERKGDITHLVATDGHKLISIDVDANEYFAVEGCVFEGDFKYIIPRSAIEEFIAPDKLKCEYVNMAFRNNRVVFEFDGSEVTKSYKLIDGTFPEWQKVVPKNTKAFVGFNPKHIEQFCKVLKANDKIILECELERVDNDGEVTELDGAAQPQLIRTSKGAQLVIMPTRV